MATLPSFGPRIRCSRRGKLGATAVPNWIERADGLPAAPGDDLSRVAGALPACLLPVTTRNAAAAALR
jgi:hypothetical protein